MKKHELIKKLQDWHIAKYDYCMRAFNMATLHSGVEALKIVINVSLSDNDRKLYLDGKLISEVER